MDNPFMVSLSNHALRSNRFERIERLELLERFEPSIPIAAATARPQRIF